MISSLYFVVLLLLTLARAELLHIRDTRGVPQVQLDQFELLAQYARAAYCYDNIQGRGPTVACASGGGYCPDVEKLKPVIIDSLFAVGVTKTAGYVATDSVNQLIIVAIQGTSISSNPIDLLTDLDINRVYTWLCGTANTIDGCSIHEGFWQATSDVLQIVERTIAAALAMNPNFRIVLTGHSLGGAVAALLGATLRNNGLVVDIKYTYGQPSLGGADVSNYIQNQAPTQGNNYRITHSNDVVPQLSEHDWDNWDQYYPEFWISTDKNVVQTTDISVVTDNLYEANGNEGDRSGLGLLVDMIERLPAHYVYFHPISKCNANAPGI